MLSNNSRTKTIFILSWNLLGRFKVSYTMSCFFEGTVKYRCVQATRAQPCFAHVVRPTVAGLNHRQGARVLLPGFRNSLCLSFNTSTCASINHIFPTWSLNRKGFSEVCISSEISCVFFYFHCFFKKLGDLCFDMLVWTAIILFKFVLLLLRNSGN